ncbi:hypothetical protein O181_115059 [Austropuccinia psidii MF-1]|uniref:Uncharacterized protein n=1 Tax=Austropuccinia psidii MF-1 TaxID=1389203 RepID=A0A9Q3PV86_9BASI|nr:hypothetical protein [Austropuccinia psidii MF-1]
MNSEAQFRTTLTSKQNLSLLKMLRKNIPAFAIGEEPLGTIKVHDMELYLDVERPYPPMLRRPPLSACDSKPEHKHDSQNTINQWYSQDTNKTWS